MKRLTTPVALGIVAAILAAPVLSLQFADEDEADAYFEGLAQTQQKIRETMRKGKTDDAALKEAVVLAFLMNLTQHDDNVAYVQTLMRESEIPRERQVRVLEGMVREGLAVIEKGKEAGIHLNTGYDALPLLATVPDYDALPVVKECLGSKFEGVRYNALITYAGIEGAKAIPFLREALIKAGLTDTSRLGIYRQLERTSAQLAKANKTNDVAKLNAFLTEMKQAEQGVLR